MGFNVDSPTQITVTIPTTASTGLISVVNAAGTGQTVSNFTVSPLFNFAAGSQAVQKYGVYEVVLTGNGGVTNPFDTICTVTFTPPSGAGNAKAVQAFYDGGNTWRARCYVTETGTWTWSSTSTDTGLVSNGNFVCGTTGTLKGMIKPHPTNPKHWATDSGQTFLGMSDTAYFALRSTDVNNSAVSDATYHTFITQEVSYGINLLHTDMVTDWENLTLAHTFTNTTYNFPLTAAFQQSDSRVRWLLDNFPDFYLVMNVVPLTPSGYGVDTAWWPGLTQLQQTRYMRYVTARYAAFPQIIWSVTNDTHYGNSFPYNNQQADEWGTYWQTNDKWSHLVAAGQERFTHPYWWKDTAWSTYIRIETDAALSADNMSSYTGNNKHVYFSEDRYEGVGGLTNPQYFYRWFFWSVLLSGATPTYGNLNYDKVVPYDSTAYVGLDSIRYIRPYLTSKSIDRALFTPNDSLVSDIDGATGSRRVKCMQNSTNQYVVYHPNSSAAGIGAALKGTAARIRINLTGVPGSFTSEWFRASDGTTLADATVFGGASRDLTAPWTGVDVVLVLTQTGVSSTPTITSFNPATGATGTSVVITGTNFTGATNVKFNGVDT